jgi:hypothetical protein
LERGLPVTAEQEAFDAKRPAMVGSASTVVRFAKQDNGSDNNYGDRETNETISKKLVFKIAS